MRPPTPPTPPTPARAHRPRARRGALLAGALVAIATLTACGADDAATARDDAATSAPSTTGAGTDAGGAAGTMPSGAATPAYPAFAPGDYDYTLGVQCFCPALGEQGRVLVQVRGGEVTSAVVDAGATGAQAPEFARLGIQDVIDRANEVAAGVGAADEVGKVTVDWPDGQAWPNAVQLDPLPNAVDDEVSYTISDVVLR